MRIQLGLLKKQLDDLHNRNVLKICCNGICGISQRHDASSRQVQDSACGNSNIAVDVHRVRVKWERFSFPSAVKVEIDKTYSGGRCTRALHLVKYRENTGSDTSPIHRHFSEGVQPLRNSIVCHRPVSPSRRFAGGNDTDKGKDDVDVIDIIHHNLRSSNGIEFEGDFNLCEGAVRIPVDVEGIAVVDSIILVTGYALTKAT